MRPTRLAALIALVLAASPILAQDLPILGRETLAAANFGPDAPWFLHNIPFLEIDDPEIQQIYFYRWKLFRAHIREIGSQGTTITEFLDNVPWARQPFTDLNDSSSFHIAEGRWLRDPAYIDSLIDHLYSGGGNDRHFSESIAAATRSRALVTGDPGPGLRHLDTMQYIYNQWDDHFDRRRNLYWVEPIADATEYTIASIDASGAGFAANADPDQNRNGFTRGYAFRPTINSYQYGNALAIAHFARLAGKPEIAEDYERRAMDLRSAVLTQLWNPTLQHFTDRYQRSTASVTAGNFIRGRELAGYLPWFYDLPPRQPVAGAPQDYASAWKHLLAPTQFAGPYGLRTVEPTYPRYLAQYRYDQPTGLPECQWNGPSWPFQTSQILTAMANLLNDYPAATVTRTGYLHLLRQYTHQHFLSPGHPDLQEDYNPDTGAPIVGLPRSHHYNHSTYIDLILNGLIGIRPRFDETLEIDPLLPDPASSSTKPIRYFALDNLRYHNHDLSIVFDADGGRYHLGAGLSIFAEGRRIFGPGPLARVTVDLPKPTPPARNPTLATDLAVNLGLPDGPHASASSSTSPEQVAQAIDGRLWFFPEIPNGWSPTEPTSPAWYAVDLGQPRTLSFVELYFFAGDATYRPPASFRVQYQTPAGWQDIPAQTHTPAAPLANGSNTVSFAPLTLQHLRVLFAPPPAPANFRLIELKAFAPMEKP